MIKFLELGGNDLVESLKEDDAIWVHVEKPNEAEFNKFEKITNIPMHILKDVKDTDEMPHLDFYDKNSVIFLDIPVELDESPNNQTRSLCIIVSSSKVYTITDFDFNLIEKLKFDFTETLEQADDLFLVILLTILYSYIEQIKKMENESNWDSSVFKNQAKQDSMFFKLLDLQKSLIDFETSIEANNITLQALKQGRVSTLKEHQQLWFDNILIESSQVSKMCAVFGEVLAATTNIAESIVSNTLNDVMKTLTSLTILFSIPTIISGLYTMNTTIPAPYNHFGFPIFLSIIAGIFVLIILKKKNML